MSAEWVTAIAAAGTFIVIAASAIAALLQLRHMRTGNQISAYNECRERMEEPDFLIALDFIRFELPARIRDGETGDEIVGKRFRGEYAGIRAVANLFESMGLFVKSGMMEEHIACELWSAIVLSTWEALRPITAAVRSQFTPGIWVNFEYMAAISKRYISQTPQGEYPAGVERMPLE